MWILAAIFLVQGVLSSPFYFTDQCVDICKNAKLPTLELDYYEQVVCQRGCRFFNIIKFKDDIKINTTKKECHISCEESYVVEKENEICKTGCNLMAKKQKELVSTLIIEAETSIVLASPDREIEFDLLLDPSIKNQLEIGFTIDYKIPETHIRTMPIEITEEEINLREKGDWLDCASRNSGIPRWILLSAILLAVLMALWLSFSSNKRGNQDEFISDDKLILEKEEAVIEKDPALLEAGSLFHGREINFSPPPKYSESEKI